MPDPRDLLSNPDAERSVLGALLIDPAAIGRVQNQLRPADFYIERNGLIFEAIVQMWQAGTPVDFVTLNDHLQARNSLQSLGGAAYLSELFVSTPSSLHVEHYAAIVVRLNTARQLVLAAGKIAQLAHEQNAEIEAVFAQAQALLNGIAPLDAGRAVVLWRDSLFRYLNEQEQRAIEVQAEHDQQQTHRLRFPWRALQRRVRWIRPAMLVLIGAESGIGKTMFLECCAEHWARQGFRVAFFHFELSHQVMWDRRTCRQTGLAMAELEDGVMSEPVTDALAEMDTWLGGINYIHCPGWTMERVVAAARQLASRGECDLVIVDYLQKAFLSAQASGLTPAQVRGQQVEALKTLAEQLEIPVILASQLNRTAQFSPRKTRASIRDTGEADEKANIVLMLDREVLETPMELEYPWDASQMLTARARAGEYSLVLRVRTDKNTLGPTGDDDLLMDPARFWIMDKTDTRTQFFEED